MKTMLSPKPNMREKIMAQSAAFPRRVSTYGAVAKAAGFPRPPPGSGSATRSRGIAWQRVLGAAGAIKLRGDYAFEQRFRLEARGSLSGAARWT